MFQKTASRPLFWGLVALGALSCVPAMAQESTYVAPLKQPSLLEAVDQVSRTDTFWSESGLGGDAKSSFLIDRDEARIQKRSENFEVVYLDIMKQQSETGVIMRTQDISNTYTTSLMELQK